MKRILFLSITFFAVSMAVSGQNYAVSGIPAALLKNANAVIRLEDEELEVMNPKQSVFTRHYAITILNEKGDRWAELVEYYDKLRAISDVEGYLYNAAGKQIRKMKKKDMEDLSSVSDMSLMEDDRIKRHNFYHRDYPYTIEYKVVIENKANLFFPMWAPRYDELVSVEKSTRRMISSPDYEIRYKAFNYAGQPEITEEKKKKVMTWKVSQLPALVREPYAPMWHELSTAVIFGPTAFQVGEYKGNMMSWQDFGKFVYALKEGRDKLPDVVKMKVKEITGPLPDNRQKIAALYRYMQQNTRYISIQLGIGGWQPFDAAYVASKGYGDCKALTNYMYSLLKESGINSYYALVRAGKNANYITEDFPAQQFNHVILCVPDGQDTVWLECTSQTMQPGYLGDFTSDRVVLLVDENGGRMVRTPKYGVQQNLQVRNLSAALNESGTLNIKASTRYAALQQDDLHGLINSLTKTKVKEYLHEQLDFATYDVNSFDYKEQISQLPYIQESLDITVSNYATVTGKRLFITPNVMTRSYRKPVRDENRRYDMLLGNEYQEIDSVTISLPPGFQPEAIPKPREIESPFGKYRAEIVMKENQLFYYRRMEQYGGRFPAADYDKLVSFYQDIYTADRARVVLVKQDNAEKKAF
ncbi:MAG TPA: DUF3857 domain-containing protein [Chitinophagaceae bacterium]|nr:DUF3857 domain-containing protein [Chitinophagaceae bacterium]